ncbi:MAG TPA: phosphatidate cytidylyltransferase, partial [Draconibacterium sp.]|nr:phosphatidate cytidylyltransferase [Draconibacterium sp.]
ITRNGKQLKSIHGVERKSVGSYLLPLSIYITFLISNLTENKFIYILPMLILAISDPMAAILGINIKNYNGRIKIFGRKLNKTWLGSGAFLASSFVISIIALYFHRGVFDLETFWLAMLLSIVTTLSELISWRGFDNLSIPLSAVVVLVVFL